MSTDKITMKMELDRGQARDAIRAQGDDLDGLRGAKGKAAEAAIVGVDGKARDASGKFVAMGKSGADAFGMVGLGALQADRVIAKVASAAYELDAALKRLGERQKELAGNFNAGRARLGELAGQINNGVNDDAFALSQAKFARDALMSQSAALNFRKSFNDSGAQFVGKTMPAAESGKFEASSAKLAAALGIDPAVVGNFMGTVSGIKNYKNADEALGVGYSSLAILQSGSGDTAHLATENKKLLASLYGDDATRSVTNSPDEVATMISAAAEFAPGQESENARAAARALRDFNSKKAAPLLKEAGITANDSPLAAMRKLKPVVEAKARAQGVKPMDVLSANVEDITGATALAGYFNKGIDGGIFDSRMGVAAGAGAKGASDRLAAFEFSRAGLDAATFANQEYADTQLGSQNAAVDIARKAAKAKLTAEGRLDTGWQSFKDSIGGKLPFIDIGTNDKLIDEEARAMLRRAAPPGIVKQDAMLQELTGKSDQGMGAYSTERTEELRTLVNQIDAAGGNALQSLLEETKKQNDLLRQQNEMIAKQGGGNVPAPLQPAPPVPRRP